MSIGSRRWYSPRSSRNSQLPLSLLLLCAGRAIIAAAQQTAALHGEVIDSVTHRPIARVLVDSLAGGSGVLTDNAGRFSFASIPPGTVGLGYRRPGYFDPLTGQQYASRTVPMTAGTQLFTLLLEPAAAIHGQVLLPEGDSPIGLHAALYAEQVTDGRRHWQQQANTTVRSDGSFSFGNLAAGSFLVHLEASIDPSPPNASPSTRTGYAPIWAPDTGDIHAAGVISPGPGQTAEIRLRVARAIFYPVRIRVAGTSRSGFFQISGNGFLNWSARLERDGSTLVTELPNGKYSLRAGGGRRGSTGELSFQVNGAPVSGLSIAVQEQGETGDGLAGGRHFDRIQGPSPIQPPPVTPQLNSLTFVSANAPEQPMETQSVLFDPTSGTGTLRDGVPPPGDYWVSEPGVGSGYLTSLSSGGVDLLTTPLTIASGVSPVFSATFGQDGGTVNVVREGALKDQPCLIELIPLSPGGQFSSLLAADPESQVGFSNLAPGDYLVLAVNARHTIAFREPGVLAQLTGTRVTVSPGASVQVMLSRLSTLPLDGGGAP